MPAKKQLGQHFLVDENILGVIGRLAGLEPEDVVLEIGPGLGILTAYLGDRVARVHAVELDRSLEPRLRERLGGRDNIELVFGDALHVDLAAFAPTKLVANLPYNVATPLIVESLDGIPSLESWCVMVQRTGFHAVSREVFRPRPNVESALVAFRRTELPAGWRRLKAVVEGAFAHRRKTLPNSLELSGIADRSRATAALDALGRGPSTRAEQLAPPEFVRLAEALR